MGSRGLYHDGGRVGLCPRIPWAPGLAASVADWTPDDDTWELYNIDNDGLSQRFCCRMPENSLMKELSRLSLLEQRLPRRRRPSDSGILVPNFTSSRRTPMNVPRPHDRMPEFRRRGSDAFPTGDRGCRGPAGANGVLYSLGAFSGA